jgi:hypothetical protein
MLKAMYKIFDNCISDFIYEREASDYWYDCAILESTKILKQFNDNDWLLLLSNLKDKSIFWKKRLIECLGDLHNKYELEVILEIIDTSDEDLFVSCVDSLRLLDLTSLNNLQKEKLLLKSQVCLKKASPPVKLVLEEIIKKLM